jgi:hypothetical protein
MVLFGVGFLNRAARSTVPLMQHTVVMVHVHKSASVGFLFRFRRTGRILQEGCVTDGRAWDCVAQAAPTIGALGRLSSIPKDSCRQSPRVGFCTPRVVQGYVVPGLKFWPWAQSQPCQKYVRPCSVAEVTS